MMIRLYRFAVLAAATALFTACGSRRAASLDDFDRPLYTPAYASGFEIVGTGGGASTLLRVRNPWQGAEGVEKCFLITRNGEPVPAGFEGEVLHGEARRIVCMSSTQVAMLDALGAADRVVGVSGFDYITTPSVAANRDKVGDVGFDGNVNYELLLGLEPDLVLLYGVNAASGMESRLRELGIPFAYIGEYLEESPLGKAEWLVAVAELAGEREAGETLFRAIPERYEALREQAAAAAGPQPKVMINTPYGDSWFMASTRSYLARLIADAGGDYIYRRNTSNRSLPIDLEEAYLLTAEADVWLNVGNIPTLRELRTRYPKFADVRCVRQGAVYNCDRRITPAGGNDYWESGVVRPDLVLRDLIRIFHPELVSEDFYYYRQVE
jgi:ABC-type fe3+-hydroxamate transport system, periplasmic component